MRRFLKILSAGGALSQSEAAAAMHLMMRGEAAPEAVAGLLMGLRSRGETLDELTGFTRVMREYALHVDLPDADAIDIVGTGGDATGTFNISTAAAFVCAGAGVTVAKHGNRSVSSQCGSADVLAALGIFTDLGKVGVEYCLQEAGMAFLFAPFFHPAMRHVMPVRRTLGVRTFFNILGPLCNPAGVKRYFVGAFSADVARTMAGILSRLGATRALTVHAEDGLDELSLCAPSTVFEGRTNAEPVVRTVRSEALGFAPATLADLRGGTATENAAILRAIFDGEKGPKRDVVILNATYGLHVSGRFDAIPEALAAANASIDSGAAKAAVERLAAVSQEAALSSSAES